MLSGRQAAALSQTSMAHTVRKFASVSDIQAAPGMNQDVASLTGAYLSAFLPRAVALPTGALFLISSHLKAVAPLTGATIFHWSNRVSRTLSQAVVPHTGTTSLFSPLPPPESDPYTTGSRRMIQYLRLFHVIAAAFW